MNCARIDLAHWVLADAMIPGSKPWQQRLCWIRGAMFVAQALLWDCASLIPAVLYLSQSFLPPQGSKWVYSAEAADETYSFQHYVAALVAHDVASASNVFAASAFDLRETNRTLLARGRRVWRAFLRPDNSVLANLPQLPMAWGALLLYSPEVELLGEHICDVTQTDVPITIWLTTFLRGGVARRPAASMYRQAAGARHRVLRRPA